MALLVHAVTTVADDWAGDDLVEWIAAAAVLVALTTCVLGMIRGDVFDRSTARWATAASWSSVVLLVLPVIGRLPATNMALQSVSGDWDALVLDKDWWYLYVGMMTLSFLALVLRRGAQLRADQEGLI